MTELDEEKVNITIDDRPGYIPRSDFYAGSELPRAGETIRVYVEKESHGVWLASKDKADRMGLLDQLKHAFNDERPVEGEIVGVTDGGFNVDLGVKAFLPASQVSLRPVKDPNEVLGQPFQFKIIRFERGRQNVVVSRRVLLECQRDQTF